MCSTASILSLCMIALDRYIRIKDPLQYTNWVTRRYYSSSVSIIIISPRSVPSLLLLVWTISALISFLPIMLDLHVARYLNKPGWK